MSNPGLQALLALQDLDLKLDQEAHRKASLPQRGELAQLDRSLAQLARARAGVAAAVAEVAARQEAAENELKASEQRVATVNARLYGGSVSASRDLQAMATDVEGLKKRISDLEDKTLGLMDEREPLDAELAGMDAQERKIQEQKGSLTTTLSDGEAEADASIQELSARRPGLVAEVPPDLLAIYDRLRPRLGGVAVARLTGGKCEGCHLALPAVELDRIRHRNEEGAVLEYCEQCGRLLVVPGD